MSGEYSEPMTYRRLDEVLIDLGFVKTVGSNYVVYKNARYDAVEILPQKDPEDVLSKWHYLSVRNNVKWKGVTTEQSLDERFNRPAQTSETAKPARRRKFAPRVAQLSVIATTTKPYRENAMASGAVTECPLF
ncbi:hypothetical protein LBMAG21_05530 [Armatimonadota bacterium]|nr:hypothetical protein LBMAG21_05530 [Armatimonadota bacterium]